MRPRALGLNNILFTHRNHKLNKQVQETQKQYAYLSVTYIQNDNHTDTRAFVWHQHTKGVEHVPLEFIYLVPGESYRRRLRSFLLLLCSCDVFRAPVNSLCLYSFVLCFFFQMTSTFTLRYKC